jgi:uncharacterized protein
MEIKFSDIKSRKERKKPVSFDLKLEPTYFEGEKINFLESVKVEGYTVIDNEIVILSANIKAQLELICSRCLETFIYPIDIDIEERFTNNETNLNDEVVFVKGDILNITEIVESAIISSLPIKRLCNEDCKGLCQNCGVNLNKQTCDCNNEDVDIRLAELKALLNNKEV